MEGVNWIHLAQDRGRGQALESTVTNLGCSIKERGISSIAEDLLASHEELNRMETVISIHDVQWWSLQWRRSVFLWYGNWVLLFMLLPLLLTCPFLREEDPRRLPKIWVWARGIGGWPAGRWEGQAEFDCWLQNDLNLHLLPRGKKLKVCTR